MTEEQLQLLRSLRPHGQDEDELGVSEARSAAEKAGITIHLNDERQTDLAMRAAMSQIEPPAGLEDSLRTAMRAARGICEPPPELRESVLAAVRDIEHPAAESWQSRRRWLGWGAGIAASLALGAKWWWETQAFTLEKLNHEITGITRRGISLSLMSMDRAEVGAWLVANKAPRISGLPEKLDALVRKGCHLYEVENRAVSLECFLLPDMRQLHLYSTPSAGLSNPPASGTAAKITRSGDLTLATWASEERTLVLVSHESPDLIRSLLG